MPDVWEMPNSLSPSRMGVWLQCPLRFRVESIQKLRGPSTPAQVAGTTMHAALEALMQLPGEERTVGVLIELVEVALIEIRDTVEYQSMGLTAGQVSEFEAKCRTIAPQALEMKLDLAAMNVEATEQRLEVDLDGWILRGDIDLLEDRPGFGRIIWDWKSGKAPAPRFVEEALLGLKFYALMARQHFGEIPAGVGLLYIATRQSIKRVPTEESVEAFAGEVLRVRDDIARACATDSFEPRTSVLCDWCDLQPVCPAHGGSEDDIAALVALRS